MTNGSAGEYRLLIIAAAAEITGRSGWSSVTMSRLAQQVGVSRQTVYNEVGTKPELAEAMVLAELAGFLAEVERAFDDHPDDVIAAIRDAVRGVLELAADHTLLRAIVASTYGADSELLPLLTTRSLSVLALAGSALTSRLPAPVDPGDRRRHEAAVDAIVRTVLSHVMQPTAAPADVADDMAWVAKRLLTNSSTATWSVSQVALTDQPRSSQAGGQSRPPRRHPRMVDCRT